MDGEVSIVDLIVREDVAAFSNKQAYNDSLCILEAVKVDFVNHKQATLKAVSDLENVGFRMAYRVGAPPVDQKVEVNQATLLAHLNNA